MTKRIYFILVILVVVFFSFVIFQKTKKIEIPVEQENIRQEERSEKVEIEGQLVEGFPEIPTFPDSVVEKSYKKESGGKVGYEADYLTDKPAKEAMLWYKDEFTKLGWSIYNEQIEGIESEFSLSVQKGKDKVNIFAEPEEGKTEISVEIPIQ